MCRTGTPQFSSDFFEGKGAANRERHQLVTPDVSYLPRLVNQFPRFPNSITRRIRADIEILSKPFDYRLPRIGDSEKWTCLRIALKEEQKVIGKLTWQDYKISLCEAWSEVGGRTG